MKVIDAENPLDLSQSLVSSLKFPPVIRISLAMTSGEELFVRKCNVGRCPFPFEQFLGSLHQTSKIVR
jgi:hypothetical protein